MLDAARTKSGGWIALAILAAACGCRAGARSTPPCCCPSTCALAAPPAGGSPAALAPSAGRDAAPGSAPASNIRLAGAQSPDEDAAPAGSAIPESVPLPAAAGGPAPTCTMALGDALALGLAQNPDLLTIRGTATVSAAVAEVAGVYPWNPFVQAEYFPQGHPFSAASSPGGLAGSSNYYVWLMQRFELGHQRRYREQSASAAFGQVRWNIRQAELLNLAQTERLFFTALYLRQLADLAADGESLAGRLVEIVERRLQAALATNLELVNARVAARQARRQYRLAEANYQTARLALAQQLGLPSDASLNLQGDLTRFAWLSVADAFCQVAQNGSIDPQRLAAEMAEARPDVMAARSAAGVARANADLARAARIQDVQAGPIYQTADDGTHYLGLRLQRDFGVFNNGSALQNQRLTEVRQLLLAHDQLRRRASGEAAAAIDRYERARRYVAETAGEDAPTPRAALDEVVAQFESGRADVVNVLAIQNNLLQDLRAELDLINEVAQAAAQVTQTTGLPPERLLAPPPPELLPPVEPRAAAP